MTETLNLTVKATAGRQLILDLPTGFANESRRFFVTVQPDRQESVPERIREEMKSFRAMLPDLLLKHLGKFVAIYQGRLIAIGTTEIQVRLEGHRQHPGEPVLVRKVQVSPAIERIRYRRELRKA
jgi:hypothetical protein